MAGFKIGDKVTHKNTGDRVFTIQGVSDVHAWITEKGNPYPQTVIKDLLTLLPKAFYINIYDSVVLCESREEADKRYNPFNRIACVRVTEGQFDD